MPRIYGGQGCRFCGQSERVTRQAGNPSRGPLFKASIHIDLTGGNRPKPRYVNITDRYKLTRKTADNRATFRSPLWSRPGFLVRRLHQIHSALFFEECGEFNITPVQYSLLTVLLFQSGSDQVTLAAEVGLDRTNVADVLQRLSTLGLVRRERSGNDRRSIIASLTKEGMKVTKRMNAAVLRAQDRLLVPLAPAYQPTFTAMLLQLVEGNNKYSRVPLRHDFVQHTTSGKTPRTNTRGRTQARKIKK